MRPVLAIVGTAILVILGLLSYFVPGGFTTHGSVSAGSPEIVQVPASATFLPSLPVTVTVDNVPAGAQVMVFPCPVGTPDAATCAQNPPPYVVLYTVSASGPATQTVELRFNINAGHPFVIATTAGYGAQTSYSVTVPLWAEQTWAVALLLILGIALVAAGLTSHPHRAASTYVDVPAYATPPSGKRFCENCGNPFPDEHASTCPACGAPRW